MSEVLTPESFEPEPSRHIWNYVPGLATLAVIATGALAPAVASADSNPPNPPSNGLEQLVGNLLKPPKPQPHPQPPEVSIQPTANPPIAIKLHRRHHHKPHHPTHQEQLQSIQAKQLLPIVAEADKPSGYAFDNATRQDTVKYSGVHRLTSRGLYGLFEVTHAGHPGDTECSWMRLKDAKGLHIQHAPGVCTAQMSKNPAREALGKNFNCPPHKCDDGSPDAGLKQSCQTKKELFLHRGSHLYGRLLLETTGMFRYRYTSHDGQAAMGRTKVHVPGSRRLLSIWAWTPLYCVTGKRFHGPHQ